MQTNSANGVKGCLIWVKNGLKSRYMFRVYNPDHTFADYELRHSDLQIIIDDEDAEFYLTKEGKLILDHSRKTLGIES
jgi:hypothetical protein